MKKIIIIAGKKGTGKTTTANAIVDHLQENGKAVKVYSFATRVKTIANMVFKYTGIDPAKYAKDDIRPIYQAIGALGRLNHGDFWVDIVADEIDSDPEDTIAIIDDARFENEITAWDAYDNYQIIKLKTTRESIFEGIDNDPSETGLDNYPDENYNLMVKDIDTETIKSILSMVGEEWHD